ncbi:DUF7024 domain-containing protein [Fundidesulfovibrio soli]|uniref:DUF7024 domain-containing protein n=1 Tax=Fundidesulfovibrio soli TaxID=2922716 RepID=UPI001FAE95CF|nr:hypothetical protein [Fundidesulfovibrio soli]
MTSDPAGSGSTGSGPVQPSAPHGWGPGSLSGLVLLLAALAAGLFTLFSPGRIPGDLGDSRFNMYILEHGWRWLTGQAPSFWSAPFYYPAPDVTAFSDSHLGTLPLYAALRWAGLGREAAFPAWMALCSALSYFACYAALRRLGAGLAGAVAGAWVFAFGLPVAGQLNHAQMLPRFCVPVAFAAWAAFLRSGAARPLALALGALVWQTYCGIYLGYFLALCLGLMTAAHLLAGGGEAAGTWRAGFFARLAALAGGSRGLPVRLALLLAAGGALVPLFEPYIRVSRALGTRDPSEIEAMLPRVLSWLNASQSFWWSWAADFSPSLPLAHEHALFAGLAPMLALAALPLLALAGRDPLARRAMPFWWCFALAAILTLHAGGHSLYMLLVSAAPGVGAIRSVTRIALVLLFPLSVALAVAFTALERRLRGMAGSRFAPAAVLALVCLVLTEQAHRPLASYSLAEARARLDAAVSGLGPAKPDAVLFLDAARAPGQPFYVVQLDAMLASQDMNIPTVNGYSGHHPPGYPEDLFLLRGDVEGALERWVCLHGGGILMGRMLPPRSSGLPAATARQGGGAGWSVDLTGECYPLEVDVAVGFSLPEPQGRWTDANLAPGARIVFSRPLPRRFELVIEARPFGPNAGRPVAVRVGGVERDFVFADSGGYQAVSREFVTDGGLRELAIIPPAPASPAKAGSGQDTRRLGLSIKSIEVRPAAH